MNEPPHDLEAESSLLGAMLLSPVAVDMVADTLTAGDFYRPAHAAVFDAIVRLRMAGTTVDVVTVNDALAGTDDIKALGGASGLLRMMNETPAASSARRYAEILMSHALRRRMMAEARELATRAADLTLDPEDSLENHLSVVTNLGAGVINREPDDIAVEEFVATRKGIELPWVIPGIIRRQHKIMLTGMEGGSKSWVLRFVAICGAYGIQPFSHNIVTPVRTLIADMENPEDAIYESFKRILHQVTKVNPKSDAISRLWWRPQGINLRNRADFAQFENVIRVRRPDLVCMGPLYALYETTSKDFGWETAAREVQRALKRLMVRYDFALMLEDHAPQDRSDGMRPYGSSFWRRWPEMGIGLRPVDPNNDRYELQRWRGDRLDNDWPTHIERGTRSGSPWPFVGDWSKGEI